VAEGALVDELARLPQPLADVRVRIEDELADLRKRMGR
jgi:hypothetical protein